MIILPFLRFFVKKCPKILLKGIFFVPLCRYTFIPIFYNKNKKADYQHRKYLITMKKILFVKAIVLSLTAWTSMGLLTACSDSNDDADSRPAPEVNHPINASTRTLRDIIEKNEYEPTKFGEVIGEWPLLSYAGDGIAKLLKSSLKLVALTRLPQMDAVFKETVGTAADGSRQWNLKRYVFTYKSVSSSTGNDTTLIASVIFPDNTVGKPHQVESLTLYHHQANFSSSWLPSRSVTLMAMHAMHNSAVIEPDGQGARRQIGNLVRESAKGDLSALQMADCILAALEVMKQDNVTPAANCYSNNWGTSLGCIAATAFAQYMENDATSDFQKLVNLRATYVGEGPVMPSHVKRSGGPLPDPPAQRYYDGWNPRLPFYMSCSPDDELIDYDKLKNYYTKLQTMPNGSVNANMHWYDFYIPGFVKKIINMDFIREKLSGMPIHMVSSVLSLYDACIVNDPADMASQLDPDSESTKQ